jgi:c(7)-type cytochrome triheme protein
MIQRGLHKVVLRTALVVLAVGIGIGMAVADKRNPLATPPEGRKFLPSPVIFPDQSIPLRFFHDKHLAQDIDCETCHEAANESMSSADVLVPQGFEGEEICTNCHDFSEGAQADPPSDCATCHTDSYKPDYPPGGGPDDWQKVKNRPAGVEIPRPFIKMNHKVHVDKGIKCSTCHGDLSKVQVATRENALPVMDTCLECHNGVNAPKECRTCHLTKPDGRIQTDLPTGTLKPQGRYFGDTHDDNYLQTHAISAKGDDAHCANCHARKFCLDCHNGVAKPFKIHPNNWSLLHPLAARRNTPNCSSCHRSQNFCIQCHKRMKVVHTTEYPSAKQGQAWNKTKLGGFHPPGWVGTVQNDSSRGPNHHSFHAQRNIRACASCHTEKSCTSCHGSTGIGANINPHPIGFRTSNRCKAMRASNIRMCTKCHGAATPQCM